ncbi:DUF4817 domain-containing protein [Trichonephila clavipes]|nr:DUF4817 domain-containing protein [Trichonephila clavipes]
MTNSPLEVLLNKMSSMQEKAYYVFEYAKTSSVTLVQRHFRTKFRKEPPHRHNISRWVKQFQDTGCLCKNKSPGRKETKPEVVERIRDSFLRKKLDGNGFENTLVFTDEATFHLCGKNNRHNLRFWDTENVHVTLEHQRDSPKGNVFCALSNSCVFSPFFFAEKSINGDIYRDMLSEWLLPQLEEAVPDFILQQDGAPPHWNKNVREFLNERLAHRWIDRAGPQDMTCLYWPPRSPGLTPCDFFLGFR